MSDPKTLEVCVTQDEIMNNETYHLHKMMLIQQGILISILFISVLNLLITHRTYEKNNNKQLSKWKDYAKKVDGSSVDMRVASVNPEITIYDYQMR